MNHVRHIFFTSFMLFLVTGIFYSCQKNKDAVQTPDQDSPLLAKSLLYADSVIYLKAGAGVQTVFPSKNRTGTYRSIPDGLELDPVTGAIQVSESETGLRYRVSFTGADGKVEYQQIVLSGLNYPDEYFFLSKNDSLVAPVYNAGKTLNVSANFDLSGSAIEEGCVIDPVTGAINLKESIRRGIFEDASRSGTTKDIRLFYSLNDASGGAVHRLDLKLYYYNTKDEVPEYLVELLQERAEINAHIGLPPDPVVESKVKPRPPCIIIIGH